MKTYRQFVTETEAEGFYAFRSLNRKSAEFLYEWMLEHKIPNPVPISKLHVTILCSENSVPGYVPDPTLVMISPASYKLEMLNGVLVIRFKSDALDEQWQRGVNMGAKTKYPRFIPHVSLSYNVPVDYDYADMKPPPTFIVLDGEKIRPLVDGWAAIEGLRETVGDIISDQPDIYVPMNSLNIPRTQMPQISDADKMEFCDWLEDQGIFVQLIDIPVALLRSVQDGIDLKKVRHLATNLPITNKPVIISKDSFILDGHHRWLAILNRDPHQTIEAYRVNLSIQDLLAISRNYHSTFYKSAVA